MTPNDILLALNACDGHRTLPRREYQILELRARGLTMQAVGERFGHDREWVRRRSQIAFGRMRAMLADTPEWFYISERFGS